MASSLPKILFLLDESAGMGVVAGGMTADGTPSKKTNAERVAVAINNALKKLSEGPECEIALIGYREKDGEIDISPRWGSALQGRTFVNSNELISAADVQSRKKMIPQSGGGLTEETVEIPIWYECVPNGKSPQVAAFKKCDDLLKEECAEAKADSILLLHVFSGSSSDGTPQNVIMEMTRKNQDSSEAIVRVGQCLVASKSDHITTAYPSKAVFMQSPEARNLFGRSSEIPSRLTACIEAAGGKVRSGAKLLIHNGKAVDVLRFLQLACDFVKTDNESSPKKITIKGGSHPPADVDESTSSKTGCAIILFDRGLSDPTDKEDSLVYVRLKENANGLLKQLSSKQALEHNIDVALVSYCSNGGQIEVQSHFDTDKSQDGFLQNSKLPESAIRVDEEETQVSNGAGGLVWITKKTPIHVDSPPGEIGALLEAFEKSHHLIETWQQKQSAGCPTFILHFTAGQHSVESIEGAVSTLVKTDTNSTPIIFNLVVTESPHGSSIFCGTDEDLEDASLKALWNISSALPHMEKLQEKNRPYLNSESRGLIVNGKFDIFPDLLDIELANN
jgi:hypothetical protein